MQGLAVGQAALWVWVAVLAYRLWRLEKGKRPW
jgi:hypothetical protein